jgi:hypothetical protein
MAYKTSVCSLALFSLTNKNSLQGKINTWKQLGLLNALKSFNTDNTIYKEIAEFEEFVPKISREEIGEFNFSEEISICLEFQNNYFGKEPFPVRKRFYLHPDDGYTFVNKVIRNSKNPSIEFLKLLNIGYEWDESINNYCNGMVYCIEKSKWFNSFKSN